MNPKDLIKECLLSYPILFLNKFGVLRHVLDTIGNGYKWDEEGEVSENPPCYEKEYNTDLPKEEILKNHVLKQIDRIKSINLPKEEADKILEIMINTTKESIDKIFEVFSNLDKASEDMSLIPYDNYYGEFYFTEIFDSTLIYTIPDNVTDEWLLECENYVSVLEGNVDRVRKEWSKEKFKKDIKKIKERINEIKKERE